MLFGAVAASRILTSSPLYDPYWANVVSLLHFDGDLTDETGRSWTMLSGTSIDTTDPIYGTGSLLCAGLDHGCYTTNPINDSSVEFTVETTVDFTSLPGPTNPNGSKTTWLWSQPQNSPNGEFGVRIDESEGAYLVALDLRGGTAGLYLPSDPLDLIVGEKYHFAHAFDGSVHRLFLSGEKILEVPHTVGWKNTDQPFYIGRCLIPRYTNYRGGAFARFDSFRITKGVARYTENFIPPTAPFPNFGPPIIEPAPEIYSATFTMVPGDNSGFGPLGYEDPHNGSITPKTALFGDVEVFMYSIRWYDNSTQRIEVDIDNLVGADSIVFDIDGTEYTLTWEFSGYGCHGELFYVTPAPYALGVASTVTITVTNPIGI